MKTNKDFFNENKEKGNLDSKLKDGLPKTGFQKILSMGYPITIGILSLITTIGLFLKRKTLNWSVFLPYLIITTISGYMWGIYLLKIDPDFPGWLFYPWTTIGIEFLGMTIEDWIFYPICSTIFYFVYRFFKKGEEKSKEVLKISMILIHILLITFFIYFSSTCGKSLAIHQGIFGLFLIPFVWNEFKIKHFLKVEFFVIIFAAIWDYMAVSILARIFPWCSHWSYIAFDAAGNAHHSSIFLDYERYPWAWILDNPIEVTPWMAITSSLYVYFIITLLDRVMARKDF